VPSGSCNTTRYLARPDADLVLSQHTEHKVWADGGQYVLIFVPLDAVDDALTRPLLRVCVHPWKKDAEDEAIDDQKDFLLGLLPSHPRVAVATAEERCHIVTLTEEEGVEIRSWPRLFADKSVQRARSEYIGAIPSSKAQLAHLSVLYQCGNGHTRRLLRRGR